MRRGHAPKAALTPEEKLKAAYFYLVRGVDQHTLADLFGVNGGRIAEAVIEVRKAIGMPVKGDAE